jgi:hypothetical protein
MMSNPYHVICWPDDDLTAPGILDLRMHASIRMYQWFGDHREGDPLISWKGANMDILFRIRLYALLALG